MDINTEPANRVVPRNLLWVRLAGAWRRGAHSQVECRVSTVHLRVVRRQQGGAQSGFDLAHEGSEVSGAGCNSSINRTNSDLCLGRRREGCYEYPVESLRIFGIMHGVRAHFEDRRRLLIPSSRWPRRAKFIRSTRNTLLRTHLTTAAMSTCELANCTRRHWNIYKFI